MSQFKIHSRNCLLLLGFLIIYSDSNAQQKPFKQFLKLSRPEKCWVITHPFIVKKAFRISTEAVKRSETIHQVHDIKYGPSGGQTDAFRHAYWMALLSQQIRPKKAHRLGVAHEKGNYHQFKKGKKEDGSKPSKTLCDMDLWNNAQGIKIGSGNKKATRTEIEKMVIEAIKNGNLRIVKMDEKNRFLDCQGNLIPAEELRKWDPPKCLVFSNE